MSDYKCRFCQAPLKLSFCNLGLSPLSNAYVTQEGMGKKEPFYPLHAYLCSECFLVQLPDHESPSAIFSEYAYFSSYSSSWLNHCEAYCEMACDRFALSSDSQVIELASNDGYLLQFFKNRGISVLGIEPAANVAHVAQKKGIPTQVEFFGFSAARSLSQQADLLIGNNVLAHVPNLNEFVASMKMVLKPQGTITMEFPHLLKLIEEAQFDTIYHEHFSYFSLKTAALIFYHHGLEIFDVERLPTHGGSLRIYAKHREDRSRQLHASVHELLSEEDKRGLLSLHPYNAFGPKVESVRQELLLFIEKIGKENKTIAAYGAPAKGNTLLNYCKITSCHIPFTVDKNSYKQGKFLPGSHIPIHSPQKIAEFRPDYLLVLPWNLREEIIGETEYIRAWGGKHVICIPQLEIL